MFALCKWSWTLTLKLTACEQSWHYRQILLLILLSASTSTCHVEQLFNIKAAYICLNEWLIDKLDCLTHCVYILCAPTLPTIIRKLKQATSLSQTIAVGVWPLKSRSSLSSSTCTSVQMTSVLETSWVTHHATSHELQLRTYFCTCKLSIGETTVIGETAVTHVCILCDQICTNMQDPPSSQGNQQFPGTKWPCYHGDCPQHWSNLFRCNFLTPD